VKVNMKESYLACVPSEWHIQEDRWKTIEDRMVFVGLDVVSQHSSGDLLHCLLGDT
jgi:hypothetical protein